MSRDGKHFDEGTLNAYAINNFEVHAGDRFGWKVVLVVHEYSNSFACYRAPTSFSDAEAEANGDFIDYSQVARFLFPTIFAELVQRGYDYGTL